MAEIMLCTSFNQLNCQNTSSISSDAVHCDLDILKRKEQHADNGMTCTHNHDDTSSRVRKLR